MKIPADGELLAILATIPDPRGRQGRRHPLVQPHGQSIHLLSLLDHATGGVLGQLKMPPKTNEHKTAMLLLKSLVLKGKVITDDAMFCQRDLCEQIIDSGGDYLFTVKDNQPKLNKTSRQTSTPAFPPYSERLRRQQLDEVRQFDKGHGRIEIRHLQVSSRLAGYLQWPGFAQAIRIERSGIVNGKRTTEVSHAITSIGPDRANAKDLLELNRGHWGIENRLHWVRDVTMGEDKCGAPTGHGPENLASLRWRKPDAAAEIWIQRDRSHP